MHTERLVRALEESDELRDAPGLAGLVCPCCHGRLEWTFEYCRCAACRRRFPVVDGIPLMLSNQELASHDHFDNSGSNHKHRQASYFSRGDDDQEFETTRPHGAPLLYRWLLADKFRRSVLGIDHVLRGCSALTVCGGSGMDAEFLARAGARVVSSDISLGAARRCLDRARRFHLPITPIVADVEQLPFRNGSVDLVYVHDGLHHLVDPNKGLDEMLRVSGYAVSLTEPAAARVTAIAIRLGLALQYEEAGNRVARLRPKDIEKRLSEHKFEITYSARYGMFYPHSPGAFFRFISRNPQRKFILTLLSIINVLAGRFGNKLTVQGLRGDASRTP